MSSFVFVLFKKIKEVLKYLYDFSNKGWHRSIFMYGLYTSYFLFFVAFTGLLSFSPEYLNTLRIFINYYIIFILLIRFNPFISKTNFKNGYTDFDRKIVFSAACFMLVSSSLFNYFEKNITIPIAIPIVNSFISH